MIKDKLFEMLDEVHEGKRFIDHVINPSSEDNIIIVLNNILELRFLAQFYFNVDLKTFKNQSHTIQKPLQIEGQYFLSDIIEFNKYKIQIFFPREKLNRKEVGNLIQVPSEDDLEIVYAFFKDYFSTKDIYSEFNLN